MKKSYHYILFLIACSISIHVLANGSSNLPGFSIAGDEKASLQGKVTDAKTGEVLNGATIFVHDIKAGTVSNSSGIFKLTNLPPGKYLVEVSFLGYKTIVETVDIAGDVQINFALQPTVVENETITVTGVSSATRVKRISTPISIIKKETLLGGVSSNLIDALTKTPGVSQVSTGPAISKPSIRGLGYNRVVVINDGVRQEGQQWGDEHGIEIDEYNVSKAEVLKGPASIMYGSDALAGVVNIISAVPAPQGTIKGNIFSNYQTNNKLWGFHGDIGGNQNGFIWGAYASFKAAADYKNKYDSYVFNSKFNEKNIGGYIGLNKSWGFSHILVSNFDQHLGLIEGERDSATGKFVKPIDNNGVEDVAIATNSDFSTTNPLVPRQHIQHFKVTSDNSFNLGRNRMTLTVGYQRNQRQEFGNILDPAEKNLYFDLQTVNYNLQYHFAEKNKWKTSIGINGMQQSNANKGVEQLIPEYSLFDIGTFVFTQKTVDKVTFSGGIRLDQRSVHSHELMDGPTIKFDGFDKQFTNISGSAGLSYEASNDLTLKFNIARGFRAPSIPELASNGAHEGTNRFEYGSQNLKSETSFQIDGGLEVNSEHVSLAASLFYNAVSNFIYYRKLSAVGGGDSLIINNDGQFFAFRFDQRNAKLYGAEINFDIHPHPLDWLHIENSFSYVRGQLSEAQDGSSNLPFIPAARLINEVRGDFFKKGKSIKNVYVKGELDNTFAQDHPFTGFDTETKTPGYSLVNIGLGGDIASQGKTLFSIYLAANNIGDVAYQSHLSRLKYTDVNNVTGRMGVFNMGRNFSFKVNIPFNVSAGK